MEETQKRWLTSLKKYLSCIKSDNPSLWEDTYGGCMQRYLHKREQLLESDNNKSTASGASSVPVCIQWSSKKGRYLVAERDISAGEVVFREAPLVLVPRADSSPICLACLVPLKSDWPACQECGVPLCSPQCDGKLHSSTECRLLACLEVHQNKLQMLLLNQLLTPLRTLLLLQEAPEAKPVVEALQSNSEKRWQAGVARKSEERVTDALRQLGFEDKEVVRHICGVFDTNAFMIGSGRALLPLASLMNHHCCANTQHWFTRGALVVRAVSTA